MSPSDALHWIDRQYPRMVGMVWRWAEVSSGSLNIEGLARMAGLLEEELAVLGGEIRHVPLPPRTVIDSAGRAVHQQLGQALHVRKSRPEPAVRALLGIHMDTVYPPDQPFPVAEIVAEQRIGGPGVADAKGGLAAMLTALQALECSPLAERVSWEVLINPDEEIGSPGSAPLWAEAACRNDVGLLFEPALPDGMLVGRRKGSGNFAAVVRGRSAHAGRDIHEGRNAIHALAELIMALRSLGQRLEGVSVNVGHIEGGGALNVVPDLAICRFNARFLDRPAQQRFEQELARLLADLSAEAGEGIRLELHGGVHAPPKEVDDKTLALLHVVAQAGRDLGLDLTWRDSGGTCDGNRLSAAGLPTVDSLGVRGGNIHSSGEYLDLDSLPERAKLTFLTLAHLSGRSFY